MQTLLFGKPPCLEIYIPERSDVTPKYRRVNKEWSFPSRVSFSLILVAGDRARGGAGRRAISAQVAGSWALRARGNLLVTKRAKQKRQPIKPLKPTVVLIHFPPPPQSPLNKQLISTYLGKLFKRQIISLMDTGCCCGKEWPVEVFSKHTARPQRS